VCDFNHQWPGKGGTKQRDRRREGRTQNPCGGDSLKRKLGACSGTIHGSSGKRSLVTGAGTHLVEEKREQQPTTRRERKDPRNLRPVRKSLPLITGRQPKKKRGKKNDHETLPRKGVREPGGVLSCFALRGVPPGKRNLLSRP